MTFVYIGNLTSRVEGLGSFGPFGHTFDMSEGQALDLIARPGGLPAIPQETFASLGNISPAVALQELRERVANGGPLIEGGE